MTEIKVGFKTDNEIKEWNILDKNNLMKLGLAPSVVQQVSLTTSFCVPGHLYTEQNVATITHPCAGSICAMFRISGSKYEIHDIFYYDYNKNKNHFSGLPHWNHERRFVKDGKEIERTKKVEFHSTEDCDKIIPFLIDEKGEKHFQEVRR